MRSFGVGVAAQVGEVDEAYGFDLPLLHPRKYRAGSLFLLASARR